jgi:hypothetical protein
VENVHPVHRPFSWRGAVLALALVGVIALAGLGGMALLHRLDRTRPVPGTGHGPTRHVGVSLPPRSRLSVLVLNGNGFNGVAGDLATRLAGLGYRHAIPMDAPNHAYATSLVLFRPGFAGAARRLAKDAHIAAIAPLDGHVLAPYGRVPLVVVLGG